MLLQVSCLQMFQPERRAATAKLLSPKLCGCAVGNPNVQPLCATGPPLAPAGFKILENVDR